MLLYAVCLELLCGLNVISSEDKAPPPPLPWAMGISYSWNTGWYSALNPGIVLAPWRLIGSVQIHVYANSLYQFLLEVKWETVAAFRQASCMDFPSLSA